MAGIELSAAELASLDELISKMKANPKFTVEKLEMGRVASTVVVTAILVAAAAAADAPVTQSVKDVVAAAKKVSLSDLIEIRKRALAKT
jgi:hypothetical protein